MKLPDIDTISMELFLTEKFPEDGKHSTSSVAHELDLTVNVC